jgi:hypothetical protein
MTIVICANPTNFRMMHQEKTQTLFPAFTECFQYLYKARYGTTLSNQVKWKMNAKWEHLSNSPELALFMEDGNLVEYQCELLPNDCLKYGLIWIDPIDPVNFEWMISFDYLMSDDGGDYACDGDDHDHDVWFAVHSMSKFLTEGTILAVDKIF